MEINRIYNENCLTTMARMPDNFLDCVVTSPPYWGLRDYGTAQWIGGNPDCKHKVREFQSKKTSTLQGSKETISHAKEGFKSFCPRCDAIRIDEQIGLEKTPEEYINKMVQIFREVRRILKPKGTLWLNLGDTYNNNSSCCNSGRRGYNGKDSTINKMQKSLKPKDLIGIPWRVAFVLQSDGWWLRQDIIWSKPNPMPESVKDRCTKAHEYIFLLTKSAKYYYDKEAIEEDAIWLESKLRKSGMERNGQKYREKVKYGGGGTLFQGHSRNFKANGELINSNGKRNKRSVWEIVTQPFPEAHFATFPEEIPSLCILAGCPKNGIVYDPFVGAGTTALAALKYNRKFIGSEISAEYCAIAEKRITPYLQQMTLAI